MVFCYKIITDSPRRRRSSSSSTRKSNAQFERSNPIPYDFLSKFVDAIDYQKLGSNLIDDVPEREWRLLAAMAKKRKQEIEGEKLAVAFKRMWEEEKAKREQIAAQSLDKWRRYIQRRRDDERLLNHFRNMQRARDEIQKKTILMDNIRDKEERTHHILSWAHDMKAQEIVEKAIEDEAREIMAADRRIRKQAAEEWKRHAEFEDGLRRLEHAQRKRDMILKTTARRTALQNALSAWESSLLKQEVRVEDEFKRAQHAAHAELTDIRSARLANARALRQKRARCMATFTQQLRDSVREYK